MCNPTVYIYVYYNRLIVWGKQMVQYNYSAFISVFLQFFKLTESRFEKLYIW